LRKSDRKKRAENAPKKGKSFFIREWKTKKKKKRKSGDTKIRKGKADLAQAPTRRKNDATNRKTSKGKCCCHYGKTKENLEGLEGKKGLNPARKNPHPLILKRISNEDGVIGLTQAVTRQKEKANPPQHAKEGKKPWTEGGPRYQRGF